MRSRLVWVGSLLVVIVNLAALAQLPTATILGTITDSSGAVIPGASLTARHVETGQTRTTISGENGSYRFAALPVGGYELRVELPGFQTAVHTGLTLAVAEEAVVNFTLQAGTVQETVTVTSEASLVNTTSGSLGGLVNEQKIADLPLNGRNYIDLSLLQPGVTQQINKASGIEGTFFSSNGAPWRSNNYMLDGAIMQNFGATSTSAMDGSTLGVEGIREYRVITNSFSAEYGMTMGSQMVMVSKGGTNSLHGSMFHFLRNSALDARNFFDSRKPGFQRNNFGGSLGGPIARDKLFVFGTYEGLRQRLGQTRVLDTIGAGCRGAAGATITSAACPQLGSGTPSVMIAPVIAPLLPLYPTPNLPGKNQFNYSPPQPDRDDFGQVRLDHILSPKDSWFGRYTITDGEQILPNEFPQFPSTGAVRSQFTTFAENHVFSPTELNTFRFSYSRFHRDVNVPSDIIGPQYSFLPSQPIGVIQIGGITNFGPTNNLRNEQKQNIFSWSDDLFYTRGPHSWKLGTLINRYQQFVYSPAVLRGTITFANLATFLQGIPSVIQALSPGSIADRTYGYTTFGFYTQDDWRVRSNLTLNLGLRYEFFTTLKEVHGLSYALRDPVHDAATTQGPPFVNPSLRNFGPRFGFAWNIRGDGKTALRGGSALLYDIGGFGHALALGASSTPPLSTRSTVSNPGPLVLPLTFPPAAAGRDLNALDYHLQQPHMVQYNVTLERQLPFDMAITLGYAGSRGFNILQLREGNPIVPLGTKQGGACVAAPAGQAFNFDSPTVNYCWLPNSPRRNSNWNSVNLVTASGNSWYDSLQFGVVKRLSRGLEFQSSYTWSKALDNNQSVLTNTDSTNTSTFPVDIYPASDRGSAGFDVTHNWRFNSIYHLPNLVSHGGAAAKLLNGWWTAGILALSSGYPFTPSLQTNRSRSGIANGAANIDRPDVLPGRTPKNIVSGTTAGCTVGTSSIPAGPLGGPDRYFDPCAFAIPALGFLGNASRDMLRGPGYANLDFTLAKTTALGFLGESGKLEFRAEAFNLINHANFAIPNRTVFAAVANVEAPLANAGKITSTATPSRQIQFGLKILF
jgi:hypothetical protein